MRSRRMKMTKMGSCYCDDYDGGDGGDGGVVVIIIFRMMRKRMTSTTTMAHGGLSHAKTASNTVRGCV